MLYKSRDLGHFYSANVCVFLNRELNNCIAGLENTRTQMREEIADLRRRNLELEELYHKREEELDQSRAQNEKMEKVRF